MDGVLADFCAAFHEYGDAAVRSGEPPHKSRRPAPPARRSTGNRRSAPGRAEQEARDRIENARALRRREDKIWQAIESTPNFWTTLKPIDDGARWRASIALMLQHRWEVFFITQRPFTEGDTVQRQTQRWLVEQGFDLPSVLVLSGSRGAAAKAIRLDYHVDDSSQNCFDVDRATRGQADPDHPARRSRPRSPAPASSASASSTAIGDALDVLEQATLAQTNPSLLQRIASMVGWK